ncbi:hypothetical protein WICMUC_004312 [Wickerhamomyces mucosus]|uniref:Multicopper oxidase n=1 Tax=Wickerhamomyces mucosus TaxID=1378264 RepID=A0A9P8PIW7_9ASCO|nr:hypothetical protein WICMUC_004312 [Wickerhamomyces mucosus]
MNFVSTLTHELKWDITKLLANPDGQQERYVIGINNKWPLPLLTINKGDRMIIHVSNQLSDPTSIHFHGIFQNGSSFMDGASMISQCPIQPSKNFTYDFVVDQAGTFWYHSHSAAQYGDGLRGILVVEDPDDKEFYDENLVISLSDWYHKDTTELVETMIETGHEPTIQSGLFNEQSVMDINIKLDMTYYLRIVNVGMSATQYFYIEGHSLIIIEVDGVRVEPTEVEALDIGTGQRYGVLLKTKSSAIENFPIVQVTNIMMNRKTSINWLIYDESMGKSKDFKPKSIHDLVFVDELKLKPLGDNGLLELPTHQILLEYDFEEFENGIKYYSFNQTPFIPPKVPTLNTINYGLTSNKSDLSNPRIYGTNTNAIILKTDDIVEIILNSNDHMNHPFHLHGHNFQVLSREAKEHYSFEKDYDISSNPLIRDTIMVPGRGFVQIRFKANNPGVWFFHCHTEWHAVQGLGLVFIESPLEIFKETELPVQNIEVCEVDGITYTMGNGIGNKDLLDLNGEVVISNKVPTSQNDGMNSEIPNNPINSTTSTEIITETSNIVELNINSTHIHDHREVSLKTKIIVLMIYGIIMILLASLCAIALQYHNTRISSTGHGTIELNKFLRTDYAFDHVTNQS